MFTNNMTVNKKNYGVYTYIYFACSEVARIIIIAKKPNKNYSIGIMHFYALNNSPLHYSGLTCISLFSH
jgi:hypothetical protein